MKRACIRNKRERERGKEKKGTKKSQKKKRKLKNRRDDPATTTLFRVEVIIIIMLCVSVLCIVTYSYYAIRNSFFLKKMSCILSSFHQYHLEQ